MVGDRVRVRASCILNGVGGEVLSGAGRGKVPNKRAEQAEQQGQMAGEAVVRKGFETVRKQRVGCKVCC